MQETTILFAAFIAVFIATAAVTLLGICGKAKIKDKYLYKLFVALILEVVGAIVWLFYDSYKSPYQVWNITGTVCLEDSNSTSNQEIQVALCPNPVVISSNAVSIAGKVYKSFDIDVRVAVPQHKILPNLLFMSSGYAHVLIDPNENTWDDVMNDTTHDISTVGRVKKIGGIIRLPCDH